MLFLCETGDLDYSSVLLGMLVMQDVQLGLFIAVMPTLIQAQSGDLDGSAILLLRSLVTSLVGLGASDRPAAPFCPI